MVFKKKKEEYFKNQLVILTIIAISLSVFSISLPVWKIGVTGVATSDDGYVNVTVLPAVSITVWTRAINFTSTFPGDSRNSYESDEVSTRDGLPCDIDNFCGMNISNDGSRFINITILQTEELFDAGSYDNTRYLLYNVTMQDLDYDTGYSNKNNCSTGYDAGLPGPDDSGQVGQWRAVPSQAGGNSSEVAICYLNYTDDPPDGDDNHRPDMARVEINITIPSDETEGDKSGTITFTGSDATP